MSQPQLTLIKPTLKLFDNQKHNISKLVQRRKALLTDRVGAGKTISILYAFSYIKERSGSLQNLLVLTPLSAYEKKVWKTDIQKFTNLKCIDLETFVERVDRSPQSFDVLLKEYDVIYGKHSHVKQVGPYIKQIVSYPTTMLCCDEVHAFKNSKSTLTLQLKQCLASVENGAPVYARNFWAITGTSLSKNLEDTYNIVNLISPWYLGAFTTFRDTYCSITEKVIGRKAGKLVKAKVITGILNEEEFKKKMEPLVITGESFVDLKFHWVDYNLSEEESKIYQKIAGGITLNETMNNEDWLSYILSSNEEPSTTHIKDVERHSSRFIYLQTATDGILSNRGTYDRKNGTKVEALMDILTNITQKKQSVLVYFDYYASLEAVHKRIKESNLDVVVLTSTGEHVLGPNEFTEAKCKIKPHIVLCTRAASESASYYWCNNVVFFHIPTVPSTFVQMTGRITRRNTLYPDDLNCYIFRSDTIDMYKMMVVSSKCAQMEILQGEEKCVPPEYKHVLTRQGSLDAQKRLLLWNRF